jgi:hypothetical protein
MVVGVDKLRLPCPAVNEPWTITITAATSTGDPARAQNAAFYILNVNTWASVDMWHIAEKSVDSWGEY